MKMIAENKMLPSSKIEDTLDKFKMTGELAPSFNQVHVLVVVPVKLPTPHEPRDSQLVVDGCPVVICLKDMCTQCCREVERFVFGTWLTTVRYMTMMNISRKKTGAKARVMTTLWMQMMMLQWKTVLLR
ncbi:hypothetical protein PF008_g2824 [Phytophthora fragariae]|uniref:Uncharacterized protein n=1 Tax=Phytophthora fragariae TaxID=53985 RepID=A0A6G0SH09_9STRA|nr:hypothetical protein PF008_g2824 [Phytophthora fragariae]